MRKILALVLTFMMALSLVGCSSALTEAVSGKSKTPAKADDGNNVLNVDSTTEKEKNMPITLTVGDTVITATLNSSKTSQDFIKTLPQTMPMKRWGDREYYGKVKNALPNEGKLQNGFENGDLAYWPAGGSFAVFFNKDVNPSMSSPIIIIGKVTSDLKVFDKLGESVEMKIEVNN